VLLIQGSTDDKTIQKAFSEVAQAAPESILLKIADCGINSALETLIRNALLDGKLLGLHLSNLKVTDAQQKALEELPKRLQKLVLAGVQNVQTDSILKQFCVSLTEVIPNPKVKIPLTTLDPNTSFTHL
jgi:hypothetical protein